MTLRIFGDSSSGNCRKVRWTADFLELPYAWVEASVRAGQTRSAAFLAINPAGQVPTVILEDGRPLAESNAIILHLAEGSRLIPRDPYGRALMLQWLFWEQAVHGPCIAGARRMVRLRGVQVSELPTDIVERGRAALRRLEDTLAGAGFLAGERVSLADVALLAYTRWAPEGGFSLEPYPAVRDWISRTEAALGVKD